MSSISSTGVKPMATDPKSSLPPTAPADSLPPEVRQALASGLGDFNLRELLSWLLSSVGLAERKAYLDHILQDKPKWLLRALAPVVSKIQNDIGVWLGTAYEDVPGSGPLQRFGVINNRSANQTRRAGVTDSSPARPSGRNVARFHQFKQARKLRIPSGG